MLNEAELNQIKGLIHYLNTQNAATDLTFTVKIIDSNGELARIQHVGEKDYQLLFDVMS